MMETIKLSHRISESLHLEQMIATVETIYVAFLAQYQRLPRRIAVPSDAFEALKSAWILLPDGSPSRIGVLDWLQGCTQAKIESSTTLDGVILAMDSAGMVVGEMPQS